MRRVHTPFHPVHLSLILALTKVYHMGIGQQSILDSQCSRYGAGPFGRNFSSSNLSRTNGRFHWGYLVTLVNLMVLPLKYIIINLGMSKNFGAIDFEHLTFPTHMRVDYIRVYQDIHHINIGCDPKGYPTLDYINKFVKLRSDTIK